MKSSLSNDESINPLDEELSGRDIMVPYPFFRLFMPNPSEDVDPEFNPSFPEK